MAAGVAASVFAIAAGVSFSALRSIHANPPGPGLSHGGGFLPQLLAILSHNLPAAAFLYSGVATAGISSLVGVALVGSFVGASTAGSAAAVGLGASVASVVGYAPVEFVGLLLAASAGLMPALCALHSRRIPDGSFVRSYVDSVPRSLAVFSSGLIVLVFAAVIEAALIVIRSR